jgi:hypothetical protein
MSGPHSASTPVLRRLAIIVPSAGLLLFCAAAPFVAAKHSVNQLRVELGPVELHTTSKKPNQARDASGWLADKYVRTRLRVINRGPFAVGLSGKSFRLKLEGVSVPGAWGDAAAPLRILYPGESLDGELLVELEDERIRKAMLAGQVTADLDAEGLLILPLLRIPASTSRRVQIDLQLER